MLEFIVTKRTNVFLRQRMQKHYSQPKGFVGRNICYAIIFDGYYYGHIVAGSATRFLPGRNEFFDIEIESLNSIINNIFFNISKIGGKYPFRNFTTACIKFFEKRAAEDWEAKYNNKVIGFETLIEKPRTGELYRRAGWIEVGTTKGYSCKRIGGVGTDDYTGQRIWITDPSMLKPKIVLCKKLQ